MSTFASRVWKARNLVEDNNNLLVEWRVLGQKPQSAICTCAKTYRALIRKLRNQGFIHISQVF